MFGSAKAASQEDLIQRLNPIINGWANYHRYVDSSQAFSEAQDYLWHKLYFCAVRRHSNKSWGWILQSYWRRTGKSNWTFSCKSIQSDKTVILRRYFESKAPIGSYIKVQKGRSYYDGDTAYWAMRLSPWIRKYYPIQSQTPIDHRMVDAPSVVNYSTTRT